VDLTGFDAVSTGFSAAPFNVIATGGELAATAAAGSLMGVESSKR